MKNKICLLLLLVFSHTAFAKPPKIVTTITPIASIISMITGDIMEVDVVDSVSGCPHHYHIRPSDIEKASGAEMLVYIDDNFDGFVSKLFPNFSGKIMKISDYQSINFLDDKGRKNWHFWLDLQNVLVLQEKFTDMLLKEFPEYKEAILSNKYKSEAKIKALMEYKKHELNKIGELVLLSDSLEHLFARENIKITKLYQNDNLSLKDLSTLEQTLNVDTQQCLVIDSTQDSAIYEKFNKKIVQLESENWPIDITTGSWGLFCAKYVKLIKQLQECRTVGD